MAALTPVEAAAKDNDGTDPTRPVRTLSTTFEHLALRNGFNSDVLAFGYTQPLGSSRNSIRVRVPFAAVDVLGNRGMALGDVGVRFNWIPHVDRSYGIVVQNELQLDTAARPELGAGKTVLKSTSIYAKFLRDGSIFAPALVHSESLWGRAARKPVRTTTLDLYYVPRLRNPRLYMTVDPALTVDWSNELVYPALAVTMGYKLGPMLGGRGQIAIKPSATFFSNRPTNWGVEVAFQLLSF